MILLLGDTSERSEIYQPLNQKNYVIVSANGVHDAIGLLGHMEFEWIVLHHSRSGGIVETFLDELEKSDCDVSRTRVLILFTKPSRRNVEVARVSAVQTVNAPFNFNAIYRVLDGQKLHPAGSTSFVASAGERPESAVTVEPKPHILAAHAPPFIGNCARLREVIRLVEKVSNSDSTVLILGESGTGKELIAQAVHYRSRRAARPLVPINCGAIPADLLESELFGHEKGSFTGAIQSRMGKFMLADTGTIFLDEVGDLPFQFQVKVLRAIENRVIEPIGGKVQPVDVRFIAATHHRLSELVEKKLFREDLYYRLNVVEIELPPLRERAQDIPELLNYYVGIFRERNKSNLQGFSREALDALHNYNWPGNIRELRNFVERLSILNDGEVVRLMDLPERIQGFKAPTHRSLDVTLPQEGLNFNEVVQEFEWNLIRQALALTDGNKNQAANLLRLKRTTLVEKLKKADGDRLAAGGGFDSSLY